MSSPDPLAPATTPNPLNAVHVSSTSAANPIPVTDPATPPAAPSDASTDPLAGMTPEQVDALAARITEARANRPPSLAEQFSQLQQTLTQTHEKKAEVVDQRKAASAEADALVGAIDEIKKTMRRMELAEAATAAQFAAPMVVAEALAGRDGDVASLVAEAAKSGAYTMKTPATSAQIGGGKQAPTDGMDPGMAALIQEVREATGR